MLLSGNAGNGGQPLKTRLNSKCYGWRGLRTHTYTFVINNGYEPGEKQVKMLYNNEKILISKSYYDYGAERGACSRL